METIAEGEQVLVVYGGAWSCGSAAKPTWVDDRAGHDGATTLLGLALKGF